MIQQETAPSLRTDKVPVAPKEPMLMLLLLFQVDPAPVTITVPLVGAAALPMEATCDTTSPPFCTVNVPEPPPEPTIRLGLFHVEPLPVTVAAPLESSELPRKT